MKHPSKKKHQKLKRKQQEYESDSNNEEEEEDDNVAAVVDEDQEDQEDQDEVANEDSNDDDDNNNNNDDDDNDDAPSKKQTKLAYAMTRILGSHVLEQQQEQLEQQTTIEKPKQKKQKIENPILSKHKSIEVSLDDQKLEEKAKRILSSEKKLKTVDVARVKREDLVFVNDLEKRLRKVATRGVVKLFNAIRVAQKTVESVKADGVQKNADKISALSKGGFMQMIKESSTSAATASTTATTTATSTKSLKSETKSAPKKAAGGSVPWINDDFMMQPPAKSSGGNADKSWDMDSD
ncbi:hypothetical protein BDR26DRAFT_864661 [Obelidium mucronatum]|nr:hypothetical protein BDR26DRAFT_864661 [Obelidium mucronatum]